MIRKSKTIVKFVSYAWVLFVFVFYCWNYIPMTNSQIDQLNALGRKWGLEIDLNHCDVDYLNVRFSEDVAASAEGPYFPAFSTFNRYLEPAISVYPENFLKKYVKKIYLCSNLKSSIMGARSRETSEIIVFDRDSRIDETFHHEVLALMILHFGNPEETFGRWINLVIPNPEIFIPYDSFGHPENAGWSEHELGMAGFVTNYGRVGPEDDMCEFASIMFPFPDKMMRLVETYPKVRDKYALLRSYYLEVDPRFDDILNSLGLIKVKTSQELKKEFSDRSR